MILQENWRFLSAALLADPSLEPTAQDDLESYIHVTTWTTLRYTAHSLSGPDENAYDRLARGMELMFDLIEQVDADGNGIGGTFKEKYFRDTKFMSKIVVAGNKPLTDLLWDLRMLFARRYRDDDAAPVTYNEVQGIFASALQREDWPEDDEAVDQLHKTR